MPTERYKEQEQEGVKYPVYRVEFTSIIDRQKVDYKHTFILASKEEEDEMRSGFNFIIDQLIEHGVTNICLTLRNPESKRKYVIAVANVISFYTNLDLSIPKTVIGEIDE